MNLRHIEVFHAVYVNGSVSAAARVLNVAQPSVTKVLRHAETTLGFALFERTKGRLIPTEDAHSLFRDVADIQDRVYSLRQAGQNIRHGRGGLLRVASLPSLGLGAIPEAVFRSMKRNEGAVFELQSLHHDDMVRKLYERDTDLVISYEIPPALPVASTELGEGELVAFYREEDMPDAPPRIPLVMLADKPFIRPQGGPLGRLLSSELMRTGIELEEVAYARTLYTASALVRAGVGVTVIDNFAAHATLAPGLAYRPLQPALTFGIHAIHLQSRPLSRLASAFLKEVMLVLEAI